METKAIVLSPDHCARPGWLVSEKRAERRCPRATAPPETGSAGGHANNPGKANTPTRAPLSQSERICCGRHTIYARRSVCHRQVPAGRLAALILIWMVHEDEFSASMLLLPPPDTVAFWRGRLSRVSPVARRASLLSGSEASISVSAGAVSRTYEAETIAQPIAQSA